jgi:hypothetical protein
MFHVVTQPNHVPQHAVSAVYLVMDYWDDWFSFRTMFTMTVFDVNGHRHQPGSVKIGQAGLIPAPAAPELAPGHRAPTLLQAFEALSAGQYFSLGQDENYYETLNNIDPALKERILIGLQDCAYDLAVFDQHAAEAVMRTSLLRAINESNVRNRWHRLANGDAVLTPFEFEYQLPQRGGDIGVAPPVLHYIVTPESQPPTNVHVLVGRNGVGKTSCMQSMVNTILNIDDGNVPRGTLRLVGQNQDQWWFAGLVSVSFSAFDDYVPPDPTSLRTKAAFVGLRHIARLGDQQVSQVKTPLQLADDFVTSIGLCRTGPRRARWERAMVTLSTDPLFAEADVAQILDADDDAWTDLARHLFRRLSSGHAIVLLTATRLVELVEERTLVIIDEPEGHLHPPLLSAFIRAVSDLLVSRNGVAIVATHSPVVLQEVPRSCVWKLRRAGIESAAERPETETFGENVGVLTREVFGLEVTKSGFHRLIRTAAAQEGATYASIVEDFDDQLGAEGRVLARSLVAQAGGGR